MNRRLMEMALVVCLGVWAGPALAQAPQAPSPAPQPEGVVQTYAVVPIIPHDAAPPGYVPESHEPEHGPVRKFFYWCGSYTKGVMQRSGFCCWSTHNSVGCGNLHSDLTFIFGSCRQFFGEACVQPPPPEADHRILAHPER
jgi:hypothetical protein